MSADHIDDDSIPSNADSPFAVAAEIGSLERPALVVFDCDGVLAPLTDHADDSELSPGISELLRRLSAVPEVDVAVLSGRSLAGLAQFDFDESIIVAGSYGGERRGRDIAPLSPVEAERLAAADEIISEAVALAGHGAWIERKPTSVVLHVREADPGLGAEAVAAVHERQRGLSGHACHEGSNVVEIMARPADKGAGLDALRDEFGPATTVYVGDDIPDEDAFARLAPSDVSVKVGPGDTVATRRLADPHAVRSMLAMLVADLAG